WVHINLVRIEFDPAKDAVNRTKHGVSLHAAVGFQWDTAFEREDDRFDYGELRFVALGLIGARVHVMVFTQGSDDDAVRVISLRPAEKHETRYYHDQVRL
uniref:BrnT family toxin n=1 Tax=Polymorphobacter sp. TaxID=1909290 RepID=UPI003F6EBDCD